MDVPPEAFEEYLAPGESVVAGSPGSLYDGSYRSAGSIGVTDRRVLFVAEDGGFLDVAHDAIESIRSRPRSTIAYRGLGYPLVTLLGALVAASAFVGVLVLEPSVLALLFGLLTVGGVVAAEHVRRHGSRDGRLPIEEAGALISTGVERARLPGWLDRLGVDRSRGEPGDAGAVGDDDLLVVGIVSTALLASIGLIVVVGSLLVVPLSLATLGGIALAEYGYRRIRDRDDVGRDRRLEREVSIRLVDGTVVHLRVDPDGRFDRKLSALAREPVRPGAAAGPTGP